jgi:hypothetical protein
MCSPLPRRLGAQAALDRARPWTPRFSSRGKWPALSAIARGTHITPRYRPVHYMTPAARNIGLDRESFPPGARSDIVPTQCMQTDLKLVILRDRVGLAVFRIRVRVEEYILLHTRDRRIMMHKIVVLKVRIQNRPEFVFQYAKSQGATSGCYTGCSD